MHTNYDKMEKVDTLSRKPEIEKSLNYYTNSRYKHT